MNVVLYQRNFSAVLGSQPLKLTPVRYSFAAMGGPLQATIKAEGDEASLWGLVELLRSPIEIISDNGACLWWGYISAVNLQMGDIRVGVNLDDMANNIAVAYTITGDDGKSRQTTAWLADAESEAEYGIKELLQTCSGSSADHALAAQAMYLAQKRYPAPTIQWGGGGGGEDSGTITCKGWWSTLGWKYYANANTTPVDTAAQVAAIAASHGQFIASTDQDVTSGISISPYRDGDATALYEAEQLLTMGTSNNRRMLAWVDRSRVLRVYEEPTSSNPYFLLRDGSLSTPFDTPLRRETCPVACWARLRDVIPNSVDVSKLVDPTLVFVEEIEYDVANDTLTPTPRGALNPFDLMRIKDG